MKRTTCLKNISFIVLSVICGAATGAGDIDITQAKKLVMNAFPSVEVSAITPTSLPELYEIIVNGKSFYLSKDGNYMLAGKIRKDSAARTHRERSNAKQLTREQAQKHITQAFPGIKVSGIKPTDLKGFYEIIGNGRIFYLSQDGLFSGTELYYLPNAVNLTRESYNALRLDAMKTIQEDQILAYAPKNSQYTVSVFTDVNCAYCRKFHSQIDQVMALGIRVNYLLFDNLGRDSYVKAASVWCSENRQQAFNLIKEGEEVDQKTDCDHPIDRNRDLARLMEVRQTPAFLLSNGKIINGYRSPRVLLEEIKEADVQATSQN